jgi:hypothetical protein
MARFYGSVQGDRGEATRLGHRQLHVSARSWEGSVSIDLRYDHVTDEVHVLIATSKGESTSHGRDCLFMGRLSELVEHNHEPVGCQIMERIDRLTVQALAAQDD